MNDSYRNPFSGTNAVQLGPDAILNYWCNPFKYNLFSEIKETDIYQDENNIVLMGGRSTGKSMFLRYWSFPVQFKRANHEGISPLEGIKRNKGIGFYFRIDGPTLRSFQGHELKEEDHWSPLFIHYFELTVGIEYLVAVNLLQSDLSHSSNENRLSYFTSEVCKLLGLAKKLDLEMIITAMEQRVLTVDRYRGDVGFYKNPFQPDGPMFPSGMLSYRLAELILKSFPSLAKVNIVILLDEYENFLPYQQKVVNTLLRFPPDNVKFRIGMRLEGFRETKMIGSEDYIKEGREYRKVEFEDISNRDSEYSKFLAEIATKRLQHVPKLKESGFTDIKKFLGTREDLETEALDLVQNDPERVYRAFKTSNVSKKDLDRVRCVDNPLINLLNIIWLLRRNSADETYSAMSGFLAGKKTKQAKKYKLDYIDKYKLSLMFLLCSIYRKEKQYYSFNTFAFLSSGIVGQFIELCRRSFANAEWRDREALLTRGKICREDQTRAAVECARAERQQISRIEDYGGLISRFVERLGNIFNIFHSDHRLRYPEVNQFAANIDALENPTLKNALKAAIKWSVIQKKRSMHRSGPNEPLQDIYALNRIFAPSFQISYRTRGGKSVSLNEKQISEMMSDKKFRISDYVPKNALDDFEIAESQRSFPEL